MAAASESAQTVETSPAHNIQQNGSRSNTREGVTVGPLPDDFLRLHSPLAEARSLPASGHQNDHHRSATGSYLRAPHPAYAQPIAYAPPNTVGRLMLSIVQAKLIKSYSMVFKMDPYCRIRLGHQVFETPTIHGGGKNPVWNKTLQCYLPIGCDKIDIDIFDEKSFGDDERVAWAQVDIPAAVYEGDTVDDWFPLSGKSGDGAEGSVQLTFTLHTNPTQPRAQQTMVLPGMQMAAPLSYVPGYYPAAGTAVPSAAPNVVQGRMYTDDDLRQVKEMFPEMDAEIIQSVLVAERGNVQAAIDALLQMSA